MEIHLILSGLAMKKLRLITGVLSLAVIAALLVYLSGQRSGHTGVNPYLALVVFVPTVLVGAIDWFHKRTDRRAAAMSLFALCAGIAGILLLVYLDRSNSLLCYETWIRRGMP